MMRAPSEILCKSIPKIHIPKKVAASTRGMVKPTTKPGRVSIRNGLVCTPNARKLTAKTMSTASVNTLRNSLIDVVTALG